MTLGAAAAMPELAVGQRVSIGGRVLRVIGFDPMGVSDRQVALVDCQTGEERRLLIDEVERAACENAAA
jgi:hypothetical protein